MLTTAAHQEAPARQSSTSATGRVSTPHNHTNAGPPSPDRFSNRFQAAWQPAEAVNSPRAIT